MQEPAALMQVDPNANSVVEVKDDAQNGGFSQAESIIHYSKVVPKICLKFLIIFFTMHFTFCWCFVSVLL